MHNLLLDLKYGLRTLARTPGFTLVAILTLALAIGGNTAIFSVIESVLLRRLPYRNPDQLVMLWGDPQSILNHRGQVSFTDAEDWRRQARSFEDVASFARWNAVINGDISQRVPAIQVSDAFFRVMQAKPMLGRLFLPQDQVEGKDFVVVISHELWRDRFGADPSIINKTVRINAGTYTIVGVLPPDFTSLPRTIVDGKTAIYRPCAEVYDLKTRNNRHFRAIARLKHGVSSEQAQSEISSIAKQLSQAYPKDNFNYGVRLVTLREDIVGDVRPALLLLYGGVLFVLLIGCANLANLLLARFTGREREIAIRAALGATRSRLVRQLIAESLLLAAMGGFIGLLFSSWIVAFAGRYLSHAFPLISTLQVSRLALAFTAITSILAGVAFGLLPAIQGTRLGLMSSMKVSGTGTTTLSHNRLRSMLVAGEVALALVLLTCSGLLFRTVQRLNAVEPGFQPDGVVTADLTLPYVKYGQSDASLLFYDKLLERIQAIPGVESAGISSTLPMTDFDTQGIRASDKNVPPGREPHADRYLVSPTYFRSMGITLKSGRLLNDADGPSSPPVIVIDEALAWQMWPGENPLGKQLRYPPDDDKRPWRTVVGVVGDVKQYALDGGETMQFYTPYRQDSTNYMTLAIRSHRPASELIAKIREQVRSLDADVAVSDPELLTQILADSIQTRRLTSSLLLAFASLAFVLAAVGIYGVLSYLVAQRTREIGVRMALGATQRRILHMVLRQGLTLTLSGVAAGIALSLIAGRAISSMLFGVKPYDAATFLTIPLLLGVVALLASYIPARRATAVDPMEALRSE